MYVCIYTYIYIYIYIYITIICRACRDLAKPATRPGNFTSQDSSCFSAQFLRLFVVSANLRTLVCHFTGEHVSLRETSARIAQKNVKVLARKKSLTWTVSEPAKLRARLPQTNSSPLSNSRQVERFEAAVYIIYIYIYIYMYVYIYIYIYIYIYVSQQYPSPLSKAPCAHPRTRRGRGCARRSSGAAYNNCYTINTHDLSYYNYCLLVQLTTYYFTMVYCQLNDYYMIYH